MDLGGGREQSDRGWAHVKERGLEAEKTPSEEVVALLTCPWGCLECRHIT